jgi:hypothetical protein
MLVGISVDTLAGAGGLCSSCWLCSSGWLSGGSSWLTGGSGWLSGSGWLNSCLGILKNHKSVKEITFTRNKLSYNVAV